MTSLLVVCSRLEVFQTGQGKHPSRKNPSPLPASAASSFPFFFYTKMYKAFVKKLSYNKLLCINAVVKAIQLGILPLLFGGLGQKNVFEVRVGLAGAVGLFFVFASTHRFCCRCLHSLNELK